MMGRLKRDQEQLFYSFRLEEAVPITWFVRLPLCSIFRGFMANSSPTTHG